MRRTLLAALVVASGMVGIASGAVAAFDAMGGSSERVPVRRSHETAPAGIGAPKHAVPDATSGADPVPPTASTAGRPDQAPPEGEQEADAVDETRGVLSDAFAELGIDDPTTTDVDESLPSPCSGLVAVPKPLRCVTR